MLLLKLHKLFL